jgi:hypothetical protein
MFDNRSSMLFGVTAPSTRERAIALFVRKNRYTTRCALRKIIAALCTDLGRTALSLLVPRVRTNHPHNAFALDDLAVLTHSFDRNSYFHRSSLACVVFPLSCHCLLDVTALTSQKVLSLVCHGGFLRAFNKTKGFCGRHLEPLYSDMPRLRDSSPAASKFPCCVKVQGIASDVSSPQNLPPQK